MSSPTLGPVRKVGSMAGRDEYAVTVTYDGEEPSTVRFVGSERYGGPVVMVTAGAQVFVTEPGRFGAFGAEWVRRFFT